MGDIRDTAGGLAWLERIACKDASAGAFFVDAGHNLDENVLEICRGCPVRLDCTAFAYRIAEDLGVRDGYFGGFSKGYRRRHGRDDTLLEAYRDSVAAAEERGEDPSAVAVAFDEEAFREDLVAAETAWRERVRAAEHSEDAKAQTWAAEERAKARHADPLGIERLR